MHVKLCYESGYVAAMLGIGLSYGLTSGISYSAFRLKGNNKLIKKLHSIAEGLAKLNGGEDKFLRQLVVCFDITAPRYWWTEMDTYKVGTVAQSESTMHTILKRVITSKDFEFTSAGPEFFAHIAYLNKLRESGKFTELIQHLPQSYMQRRIWTANYAVLKNIFEKRSSHKLEEWHYFISAARHQISYPEFLPCKTK